MDLLRLNRPKYGLRYTVNTMEPSVGPVPECILKCMLALTVVVSTRMSEKKVRKMGTAK